MDEAADTDTVSAGPLKGSCCCGAVAFELTAQPTMMGTCHCSRCRKLGIGTFVFVSANNFTLTQGVEYIAEYAASPQFTYTRCFCKQCGTALGEVTSSEKSFPVNANCFDDTLTVRNGFHEFVSSKPGWYEIADGAKQFPAHPHKD